jgi:protein gp37
MTAASKIEWTDYSFAPWFGCSRAGPECLLCYAEDWTVRRFHKAKWGKRAKRVGTAASTWNSRSHGSAKHKIPASVRRCSAPNSPMSSSTKRPLSGAPIYGS